MLQSMFGIGGSEIIVILIVALLFLGPDKLPDAAKQISKGIRDLKKQTRALQDQIESDTQIGGAIRDLKSALRGEPDVARPPVRKEPPAALPASGDKPAEETPSIAGPAETTPPAEAAGAAVVESKPEEPMPSVRLPQVAGEPGEVDGPEASPADLDLLIKPAVGTVAKKHG
jgi:sec-independent protein translocase protein TatB